ncbi:unnamed protein product, partial [Rotaria sp. Silwood2]
CPYNFPVYNPNGTRIESFNPLQPINDCHFICMTFFTLILFITHLVIIIIILLGNVDNVGRGKFFVMIYYQSKPIKIPCQIQSLSLNRIRISFLPVKIGTYQIYVAYRNIPINGKLYLLCKHIYI